jgi:hypothetical protein
LSIENLFYYRVNFSSINTILTGYIPISLTILGLLYTLHKDRKLRRKEYADRIRTAAGTIIAKLERWKNLSLRFFEDISPLITKTDLNLAKSCDIDQARYDFWIGLEDARANSSQRIVDEQIEMAYKDLYGYEPIIEDLFINTIEKLKKIDNATYDRLFRLTQADIYRMEGNINGGSLGYKLRETCGKQSDENEKSMNKIIELFRRELKKLIVATDDEIVNREITILSYNELFKSNDKIKLDNEALDDMELTFSHGE